MRLVRRLVGLIAGTAGALGLILCLAGLAGVWAGYVELVRRVDRVFERANLSLSGVQDNLGRATDRLRETEAELEAVRERERDLAARPPVERPGRREPSRKAVEALGTGLGEARTTLVRATEAALLANGLLDALAELPAVERVNIETDRLKEASAQLDELTERSTKLAELLARASPAKDHEVAGESSRAAEAVRRPINLAQTGSDRLEDVRQNVATSHARIHGWINGIAAVAIIVLVWIGV